MIIVYEKLKEYGFVDSQYAFSKGYLGKSRSYFSAHKALKKKLGTDALVTLALRLEQEEARIRAGRAYELSESVRALAADLSTLAGRVWGEMGR